MQSLHRRFSVITGFGLLLIVLVANAIITKRQLGTQVENQLWLSRSRLVLFELAQTESLLKDAETGQRGFLYTGDPKYLASYNLAIGRVGPSIDKVAQLTASNPRQQGRTPTLRNLAQSKLKERAQTIALYRSGEPEKAKALVLSDAGSVHDERYSEADRRDCRSEPFHPRVQNGYWRDPTDMAR